MRRGPTAKPRSRAGPRNPDQEPEPSDRTEEWGHRTDGFWRWGGGFGGTLESGAENRGRKETVRVLSVEWGNRAQASC